MTWFIGTDEAGYGPNLGPLVVAATRWRCPDHIPRLETALNKSVPVPSKQQATLFDLEPDNVQGPADSEFDPDALIAYFNRVLAPVAGPKSVFPLLDSKKLYHPAGGLAPLEKNVLVALDLMDRRPAPDNLRSLLDRLESRHTDRADVYCETAFMPEIPSDRKTPDVSALAGTATTVRRHFARERIALCGVLVRRIQPPEFNRLLQTMLKSDLLAAVTLGLVRESLDAIETENTAPREPVVVLCDKLGGRDRYAAILANHFPDTAVAAVLESRPLSRYRLRFRQRTVEIRFQVKGESNIPTALASIFDKYIRELSMIAFNRYWSDRLPNLRPTAGYPVDARRFFNDIEKTADAEGLAHNILWREK